jgi:hypothetical protein
MLDGRPQRKQLLRRPMHEWEDILKMDVRELDCENVNWIELIMDRILLLCWQFWT